MAAAALVFLPALLCCAASRPVVLPLLDPASAARGPHDERVGIRRAVTIQTSDGDWSTSSNGVRTWTATIAAPDAHGLRIHFENFHAGAGQVWIYDAAAPENRSFGPYTGEGPRNHGAFWTETLFTNAIGIRYQPALGAPSQLPFRVSEVFHWWRDLSFASPVAPQFTPSLNYSCFKDVECYWGTDPVKKVAESSVLISTENASCSATLIQDGDATGTPFLLTAGHCLPTQDDADFVDVFFGYRTPSCSDSSGDGFGTQIDSVYLVLPIPQVIGGTLLSESYASAGKDSSGDALIDLSQPDYSFVLLSNVPQDTPFQFAPIKPGANLFDKVVSVSDPILLPQAYASGSIINYVDGTNFFAVDFSVGKTDHGSSGSGMFDADGALRGVASFTTAQESATKDVCDTTTSSSSGYTNASGFWDTVAPYLSGATEKALPVSWAGSPNPAYTSPGVSPQLTLSWNAPGHRTVIAVGSPEGTKLNNPSPAAGSTQSGPLVTDGIQFFLLDADTQEVLSSFTESVIVVDPVTFDATINPVYFYVRGGVGNDSLQFEAPYHQHVQIYLDGTPLSGVLSTSEIDSFNITIQPGQVEQYDLVDADTSVTLASVTVSTKLHQIEPLNPRPPVIP